MLFTHEKNVQIIDENKKMQRKYTENLLKNNRVQGPGSRVQGPGSRVQGPGSQEVILFCLGFSPQNWVVFYLKK